MLAKSQLLWETGNTWQITANKTRNLRVYFDSINSDFVNYQKCLSMTLVVCLWHRKILTIHDFPTICFSPLLLEEICPLQWYFLKKMIRNAVKMVLVIFPDKPSLFINQ